MLLQRRNRELEVFCRETNRRMKITGYGLLPSDLKARQGLLSNINPHITRWNLFMLKVIFV